MNENYTPRAWVGCLACYNEGRLVGEWYDAADAGDVTPEDLHDRPTLHDELWCMDHENMPFTGECSPSDAAKWAEIVEDCDGDDEIAAVLAYAREIASDWEEIDARAVLDDRYCGKWDSFEDYAEETADEYMACLAPTRTHAGSHEARAHAEAIAWMSRYFDYASYARELAFEYTSIEADSGVFVFRDY